MICEKCNEESDGLWIDEDDYLLCLKCRNKSITLVRQVIITNDELFEEGIYTIKIKNIIFIREET